MGARSPAASLLLGALLLWPAAGAARAEQPRADFRQALEKASRSLVQVMATVPDEDRPFALTAQESTFRNTGFFVGTEGQVLTSLLGVAGCRDIAVLCPDGRRVEARMAATDQAAGVALLKLELADTVPLELAPARAEAGSWAALACVRAENGAFTVQLQPSLLLYRREPVMVHCTEWRDVVVGRVDVPAGGAAAPLLDTEGRLVAIVLGVQEEREAGGQEGECLALPADSLAPILSNLISGQSRRLGWLGLSVIEDAGRRPGVRVVAVLENSPAHLAGVQPGDLLLQIGDEAIEGSPVLLRRITESAPGTVVPLTLLRGEQILTPSAELGARPLLISGTLRSPAGDAFRRAAAERFPTAAVEPQERLLLQQLLQENERLRRRVDELERRLRRVEEQEGPASRTSG
jgi:serine protease DegS